MDFNILIVEDDSIAQLTLSEMLKDMGYKNIEVASDKNEAIRILRSSNTHLVLLDVFIHGNRDGIEIAKQINNLYNLPILYLTGSSDPVTYNAIAETTHLGILEKPYDYDLIKSEIGKIRIKCNASNENSPIVQKQVENGLIKTLFSNTMIGYCLLDRDFNIRKVNSEMVKLLGVGVSEIEGVNLSKFSTKLSQIPDSFPNEQLSLTFEDEFSIEGRDVINVKVTIQHFNDDFNRSAYLLSVISIEQQKEDQAAIAKLVKQNENLVHELHHRLKNNLNLISGVLYLKEKKYHANESADYLLNLKRLRFKIDLIAHIQQKFLQNNSNNYLRSKELFKSMLDFLKQRLSTSFSFQLAYTIEEFYINYDNTIPFSIELFTSLFRSVSNESDMSSEKGILITLQIDNTSKILSYTLKDTNSGIDYSEPDYRISQQYSGKLENNS